jgi:hypothetical protein
VDAIFACYSLSIRLMEVHDSGGKVSSNLVGNFAGSFGKGSEA